jgi:hypothetical protein
MRQTRFILAALMVLIGTGLVVRSAFEGLWPVSVQLIAGIGLIVYALARLRYS